MLAEVFPVLIFVAVAGLIIVGIIYGSVAARKRREALFQLAAELGLDYSAAKDHSLAQSYEFLNKLAQGSNRYAFNTISGDYRGQRILAFDYHYETRSTNSKGRRQTQHHYFSVFILIVPQVFPELVITREGWFSKIAQAFGYDDIDFESHEFSRKFCVRSKDKKFAYDVCNTRMIEYLLANDDLNVEIDRHAVALLFGSRLRPEQIRPNLDRLIQVRELIPEYVVTR